MYAHVLAREEVKNTVLLLATPYYLLFVVISLLVRKWARYLKTYFPYHDDVCFRLNSLGFNDSTAICKRVEADSLVPVVF